MGIIDLAEGASLIEEQFVQQLRLQIKHYEGSPIKGIGGVALPLGTVAAKLNVCDCAHVIEFFVVQTCKNSVLAGNDFLTRTDLVINYAEKR